MLLVTVAALLLSTVDEARGTYLHLPQIDGALTTYKTIASWDEARQKCRDDGAVVASPVTAGLQRELRTLFNNTFYFIGLDARFQHNTFVSVEGVHLEDMPVTDMYEHLDLDLGQCLCMNQREIRVVQCTARMPYVCHKNQTDPATNQTDHATNQAVDENIPTTCRAEGYTYYESTSSCYKIHTEHVTWDDASATCQAEHGHLLVVDDDLEAQIIKELVYESFIYLIGLRDWSENGHWKSVTGKRMDEIYNAWLYGAPSGDYYCGAWRVSNKIDNWSCSEPRPFICEQ